MLSWVQTYNQTLPSTYQILAERFLKCKSYHFVQNTQNISVSSLVFWLDPFLIETSRWGYNHTVIQFRRQIFSFSDNESAFWKDLSFWSDWTKNLRTSGSLLGYKPHLGVECSVNSPQNINMHVFYGPYRTLIRSVCGIVVFCVRLWLIMEFRLKQIPYFFFKAYFFSFSSVFVFISTVHVFIVSTLAARWVCNLHLYIQTIKKRKETSCTLTKHWAIKTCCLGVTALFYRITCSTVLFLAAATCFCY